MLTPVEIAALVAATKGAVEIFDKMAGPIKRVLLGQEAFAQAEGKDQRWRFQVGAEGTDLVVKEGDQTRQVIKGEQLGQVLDGDALALVRTYERKMQYHFGIWQAVYDARGTSQDPLVNAKTDAQLKALVQQMRDELLGILAFLKRVGIHLDDHYMHVRSLVEQLGPESSRGSM